MALDFCRGKREMKMLRFTIFMHNLRIFNHVTRKMSKHVQLSMQFSQTNSTQSSMNPWRWRFQLKKYSWKLFTTLKYLVHNNWILRTNEQLFVKIFWDHQSSFEGLRNPQKYALLLFNKQMTGRKFKKSINFQSKIGNFFFISLLFNINITKTTINNGRRRRHESRWNLKNYKILIRANKSILRNEM